MRNKQATWLVIEILAATLMLICWLMALTDGNVAYASGNGADQTTHSVIHFDFSSQIRVGFFLAAVVLLAVTYFMESKRPKKN